VGRNGGGVGVELEFGEVAEGKDGRLGGVGEGEDGREIEGGVGGVGVGGVVVAEAVVPGVGRGGGFEGVDVPRMAGVVDDAVGAVFAVGGEADGQELRGDAQGRGAGVGKGDGYFDGRDAGGGVDAQGRDGRGVGQHGQGEVEGDGRALRSEPREVGGGGDELDAVGVGDGQGERGVPEGRVVGVGRGLEEAYDGGGGAGGRRE